ncbi:MAG: hypothetical protein KGI49_02600 [Patescibacteria group bacterium]|nr:hypothetical protein [Patescibacteria group bacterium]
MDDKKKKTEVEGIVVVIIVIIVLAVFPGLLYYFGGVLSPLTGLVDKIDWGHFVSNVNATIEFLIGLSIPASLFFLISIVYCVERLKVIRRKEAEKHDVKVVPAYEETKARGPDLAARWKKVQDMLGSTNESDWKQAILEADTMLDMILNGLGYQGESIGEKLKRVGPGEMKTVQDAWDAHKVRNDIAHKAGFQLTAHAANEAIQQYRRVFEEFYYI